MTAPNRADVERTVIAVIQSTLAARGRPAPPLRRDTPLGRDLGLESLDWAAVVVRLEDELGIDPFQTAGAARLATLGDLIRLYESALA